MKLQFLLSCFSLFLFFYFFIAFCFVLTVSVYAEFFILF